MATAISLEESLRRNGDAAAAEEVARLRASSAEDIRAAGWAVAVHNDYRLNGVPHTFCNVKGEGLDDVEALDAVRRQLGLTIGGRRG